MPAESTREEESSPSKQRYGVAVPMRDGVGLRCDILLPRDNGERFPTILVRTTYGRHRPNYMQHAQTFKEAGYAVVLQDVRGRYDSDGEWQPLVNEGRDGHDTVEWIAEQAWSNGRIGMHGSSYDSYSVWAAAREHPVHLTTFISNSPATRLAQEWPHHNGVPRVFGGLAWLNLVAGRANQLLPIDWPTVLRHRPLATMDQALGRPLPLWREWLAHPGMDDYWQQLRWTPEDFRRLSIPVLHVTALLDGSNFAGFEMYELARQHAASADDQYLIFGPWSHNCHWSGITRFSELDLGDAARQTLHDIDIPWFNRWLKNEHQGQLPRARYYILGANSWRAASKWPLSTDTLTLFLTSQGQANTNLTDGRLQPDSAFAAARDTFVSDPEDPAGYNASVLTQESPDSVDLRQIEFRNDICIYTSAAMTADLIIVGRPQITFFASSNCKDTDWFVQLAWVTDEGLSLGLGPPGVLRARYRDSLETGSGLQAGKVYPFTVELPTISCRIEIGQKLRVLIMSAYFPFYFPNAQTGDDAAHDIDNRIATNSIHHGPEFPSQITFPILRPARRHSETNTLRKEEYRSEVLGDS